MFILSLSATVIFSGISFSADPSVKAPDFSVQDLSGEKISLADYRGKVVLIDFWATWCGPCRMSIPELVDLQNRYRESGLVVLGVSMDRPGKAMDTQLTNFVKKYRINYSVMRTTQKLNYLYFGDPNAGSIAIPTLFIVDRKGMIADVIIGYNPGSVENALEKLL